LLWGEGYGGFLQELNLWYYLLRTLFADYSVSSFKDCPFQPFSESKIQIRLWVGVFNPFYTKVSTNSTGNKKEEPH